MIAKCVHCLAENIEVTSDHVFPSSWYPSTTNAEINRLTAPSCKECNNKLSKIEESLLKVFSNSISSKSLGYSQICEKVKRSMSGNSGKNLKDQNIRISVQKKFFKKMFPAQNFPESSIVNPDNLRITPESQGLSMSVEEELHIFLSKLIRGIIYCFGKAKFISKIHEITYFDFQKAPKEIDYMAHIEHSCGPGFSFRFWEDQEFSPNGIIEITIWEKFNFFVFVENRILKPI